MSPVGKPGARQQFSAGKTRICSTRTVAGQFQLKSGMHPFGCKPRAKQQFSADSGSSQQKNSSRAVSKSDQACNRSVGSPGPDSSSVQAKGLFTAAEQ